MLFLNNMAKDVNSKQAGFYQSSDANNPSVTVHKGKNQFPQSFQHPSTCSYGVVDLVGVAKCEPGDVYPYKFVSDLNTFTMASPLKTKVNMYSAAFKVPMKAIYPRNWDIMYPIPNKGDDVPEDTRALFNLRSFITRATSTFVDAVALFDEEASIDAVNVASRTMFILESIFSDGGIFAKVNMHFCSAEFTDNVAIGDGDRYCFDDYFDLKFIPWLKAVAAPSDVYDSSSRTEISELRISSNGSISYGTRFRLAPDPSFVGKDNFISFTRMLELLRSGEFVFTALNGSSPGLLEFGFWRNYEWRTDYNIESIISYQLACAHFFNNPKIDFVYSADLYRDNLESLLRIYADITVASDSFPIYFRWNSLLKQYDVFSSRVLNDSLFNPFRDPSTVLEVPEAYYCVTSFWMNLFNFQMSLRYGDYFTGAHPQMLAVGDINAPVIDGTVNALDMTRKLQLTRLLNKVNITGPRMQDYLRALFGGEIPDAPDDVPIRLSREQFTVSGFEVNNTGDAQLSSDDPNITTTNLRLDDSRFMFEAGIDKPCWLVFVQYFDSHRIYSNTMDRFTFHKSRFDDLIPDLQFVGDQDIKQEELDSTRSGVSAPFGYNLRYMEYKQRYSYASGGFIRRLKSWAMVTDNNDGNPAEDHISPRYIRSSPSEFDRFYKSLTGYSLGTRFHFITFNTNVCAPFRQMVYAPEILA